MEKHFSCYRAALIYCCFFIHSLVLGKRETFILIRFFSLHLVFPLTLLVLNSSENPISSLASKATTKRQKRGKRETKSFCVWFRFIYVFCNFYHHRTHPPTTPTTPTTVSSSHHAESHKLSQFEINQTKQFYSPEGEAHAVVEYHRWPFVDTSCCYQLHSSHRLWVAVACQVGSLVHLLLLVN